MLLTSAFSLQQLIDSVGAYAGIVAAGALALFVLLYFSHAKEMQRLREQLDEMHQLQERTMFLADRAADQARTAQGTAANAHSQLASIQANVPPAPLHPMALAAGIQPPPAPGVIAAVAQPVVDEHATQAIPAVGGGAGYGGHYAPPAPGSHHSYAHHDPHNDYDDYEEEYERRSAPQRRRRLTAGQRRARFTAAVAGVATLIVGSVAIATLSGSDGGKATPTSTDGSLEPTKQDGKDLNEKNADLKPPPPSQIQVAVLNGTTVPGLAAQVADKLASQGFRRGPVTNAPTQGAPSTGVAYAPGRRLAALETAKRLNVPASRVLPINSATQTAAGVDATVVVTVGADRTQ